MINRTRFYKVTKAKGFAGSVFNWNGELVDVKERGFDGCCPGTNQKHQWLLLPDWSESVKQGGKQYVQCLNCFEVSHL